MMHLNDSPRSVIDTLRIETYEDIYEHDVLFRELDNHTDDYYINNHYYIGLSFYDKHYDNLLLASTVHNKTLFKYNYDSIIDYLNNYSVLYQDYVAQPEIMMLHIDNDLIYNVTIKTFWIKIIQRTWKRILKERKNIINQNGSFLKYIKNNELGIKQISLPTLRGMLCR